MFLAIDNRRMIRQPHTIEVVPYDHVQGFTADQRPMVMPGSPYSVINCTWGRTLTYQDVMIELRRLRANQGVHAITFEPMRGQRQITINAYMGEARETHVGYTHGGKIVDASFTIPFIQVDTPVYLYPMRLQLRGIIAVTSPFCFHPAPAAGRIFGIEGWIRNLGAGAGQTRVQVRNNDRALDYLSTPGDFINAAPANHRLQNAVLDTDLDFDKGHRIDANVTTIPAGGLSADATVTLWCWVFHP